MKFSGKVGNGPMNKRLNFGGDPDHGSIATLVRRALAEVCTVRVLLGLFCKQIRFEVDGWIVVEHCL